MDEWLAWVSLLELRKIEPFQQTCKNGTTRQGNDMHFQAQYEIWLNEGKNKKQKEKAKPPIVQAYQDLTSLEF